MAGKKNLRNLFRMPKQYQIVFNLLVLTTAIYLGVDIFYRVVRLQLWKIDTREITLPHDNEARQEESKSSNTYQAIIDRNIFASKEQPDQEVSADQIKNLEPTSLKIRLLGTIAGDQQSARAIIEEPKQKTQNLYKTGDSIEGAVIKKILRGKVVLRVDGQDKILSMEEATASSKQETRPTIKASPGGRRLGNTATAQSTLTLNRRDIQETLANINDILSQVQVRPYMDSGDSEGLIISNISPGSLIEKMGLTDGDIVQAVNNKQIKSPDDVIALYQSLKFGTRINLQVLRDGQQKVLNYNIR